MEAVWNKLKRKVVIRCTPGANLGELLSISSDLILLQEVTNETFKISLFRASWGDGFFHAKGLSKSGAQHFFSEALYM